ncbi:MAG: DUF2309 domain-containing protein [Pararhodobacter sp.]
MFLKHAQFAPARVTTLLGAAEAAARAIPPAFPLDATVAVNPFLGQRDEDLATASARLSRVAGVALTQPRTAYRARIAEGAISDDDLAAALFDCASPLKPADLALLKAKLASAPPTPAPLPTVAQLAAQATGTDWPAVIARSIGLWAAGHFDRGQALWAPTPGRGAYAAWRDWATQDLTPEIAGRAGFCAQIAEAPDSAERAILRACETLGVPDAAAPTLFHRLLVDLGGWAQHARWLQWQADLAGKSDPTPGDLLAIRLLWDEALLPLVPDSAWQAVLAEHAQPVAPTQDQVIDAILQDASERAAQRALASVLPETAAPRAQRPALQAGFCIDVRSEVFRRALEAQDSGIETFGFAGFFGLPVAHQPQGTDLSEAHLPVLLTPALHSCAHAEPRVEQANRIAARATRAWGRFRQAAVSSFAFVEAAGLTYGAKLLRDTLGHRKPPTAPAPRFATPLGAADKAELAARVLTAMGLTKGHAPLVLLLGHGARTTNNPHDSAYQCGACGGHSGEVSARLLAQLLNDPETRAGLGAKGITLPADTRFVAGLHDTTTDTVTLFHDEPGGLADARLEDVSRWLDQAGALARAERAAHLPGATADTLARRATDWAQTRPEWGLAGCAAFIAAPRDATRGANLEGRAFLHSYDWRADPGFATLELILTAPVVVASWISLQYYGSSVAPDAFGSGNKLIHNVTGGIGVVQGNGGTLRAGLPWQAVHDGERLRHDPLRLSVLIEAPVDAIQSVLDRHPDLRALFDNGWLHLIALEDGRMARRYRPGRGWGRV